MSKKTILFILIVAILVLIGFFGNHYWQEKKSKTSSLPQTAIPSSSQNMAGSSSDQSSDLANQDFNAQCENGEWVKVADVSGNSITLTGKLRKVYPTDDLPADVKNFLYYVEGQSKNPLSGNDLTILDNFENRDVEAQGVKSSDGKSIEVSQVRCSGAETDRTAIDSRNRFLDWLAANINSIAPTKAPYKQWVVDTAEFVDGKNVYIEYHDAAEDDENTAVPDNVDTSRRLLAETSLKTDGSYSTNILAYWEMGDEDYVLKTGADKFKKVLDTTVYQYDSQEKNWTRI